MVSVKHKFQSIKETNPDDLVAGNLTPQHWNDVHEITGAVATVNGASPDTAGNVVPPLILTNTDTGIKYKLGVTIDLDTLQPTLTFMELAP